MTTPLFNLLLGIFFVVLTVIGWGIRTGLFMLVKRMDLLVLHVEKINGRLGGLEQRMSSSEGREVGRGGGKVVE